MNIKKVFQDIGLGLVLAVVMIALLGRNAFVVALVWIGFAACIEHLRKHGRTYRISKRLWLNPPREVFEWHSSVPYSHRALCWIHSYEHNRVGQQILSGHYFLGHSVLWAVDLPPEEEN